jgi:hypothetical protein
LAAIGALVIWFLGVAYNSLRDLQRADKELAEKVSSIEVLVAGKYVTREEFLSTLNEVFTKLDRIQQILIDKP